ncbi:amidophosphoribosyltransferase [Oceanivirga miroungae]|uniref:Amidophosphoribosyltransferase n=1 Tax=Oceanivirga miroungae TaxID=1130046 RepID=A0A6I8MBE3_9FUSO|nr:amidophosphoribosyltransferase [Oceanivirga miroungae]VWL85521.1 amidophosphoribosyltransferase [Oceanivirga miroungae]
MRSINEECGVFGVFNAKDAAKITYFGLHSLQHRGQEGTGILTTDGNNLYNKRGLGLISKVFSDEKDFEKLVGNSSIGHVRYATSGSNSIRNIQPFKYDFYDYSIGICHNGNIINAKSIREDLEKKGAIFHSSSDTEVLIHLIRRSEKQGLVEQIKDALNNIKGGFTYLLLTKDTLYGAVDENSLRPLAVGRLKNGSYILASETCAIDVVGAEFLCNIYGGELAIIDKNGLRIEKYTENRNITIAAMEYIYFARPDSDIAEVNVHRARKKAGMILAKEKPVDADIVIGVPNSSLSAASGYAEEAKIPYEMGLIKNQYIARTFIEPTQELREQGVRMKLSAVRSIVKNKKVIMVDDSIVRGTTSKRIVKMLYEAGASEVHVRIASPELIFPSFYGIDISKSVELLAANMNKEQMCEYLGATSLEFLSIDGLIESVNLKDGMRLCLDSFNADYVAGLGDYEKAFLEHITPIQREYLKNINSPYYHKLLKMEEK